MFRRLISAAYNLAAADLIAGPVVLAQRLLRADRWGVTAESR
jgi:hypothetical protein